MARVPHLPYLPGEPRDADVWAATQAQMVTQSFQLSELNFAAEGLTRSRFESKVVLQHIETIKSSTRENVGLASTGGAWGTILSFPTATPITFQTGGVTIDAGDLMLARYRLHFTSSPTNFGLAGGTLTQARLAYKIGVPVLPAPASTRSLRNYVGLAPAGTHGVMAGITLFQPATYADVRLELLSNGVTFPNTAMLSLWRLKRVA